MATDGPRATEVVVLMPDTPPLAPAYTEVTHDLRAAYDHSATDRDGYEKAEWKLAERSGFLARLRQERKSRLLEVGAGTGQDSLFFQENGLAVVATDLSPEMVDRCRQKGLEAHVMDLKSLSFRAASFDAAWALNCLLQVPNAEMEAVLEALQIPLAPGALLYVGVYGETALRNCGVSGFHSRKAPLSGFDLAQDASARHARLSGRNA